MSTKGKVPEPRSQAWQRAKEQGRSLVQMPETAEPMMDQAVREIFQIEGRVKAMEPVQADLETLIRLVRASLAFRYIEASEGALALALAAISYFVDDDDAIPDYVPFIGYNDDAAVVAYVADQIRDDLDRFLRWEEQSRPIQEGGSPS